MNALNIEVAFIQAVRNIKPVRIASVDRSVAVKVDETTNNSPLTIPPLLQRPLPARGLSQAEIRARDEDPYLSEAHSVARSKSKYMTSVTGNGVVRGSSRFTSASKSADHPKKAFDG